VKVLLWHVHGAWTTAFVHGPHEYVVPVVEGRGPDGVGIARTYRWPKTVRELPPEALADEEFDVVVLQRPHELEHLAEAWLRRRPGRDVPAVYVEHNAPQGRIADMRHVAADRDDLVLVHVTHFNDLFWDAGSTRTTVIEHGVVEPAARWSGDLERLAVVTNEPIRRGRVTGTDLFGRFAAVAPLDVFGMGVAGLASDRITAYDDPPQAQMHAEVARRRAYVHLCRWTSLGLSLIEAMQMGMPVLALATTEAVAAVPPDAGVLSTRADTLVEAAQWLLDEPEQARRLGARARQVALARYGLDRFLADWDRLLEEETCASR